MKASVLFAVADNEDKRDPAAKDVLKETYTKGKLPAEIEVYPAAHGWCPPDSAVYDQKQAEKAWARLLVSFKTALA
jgi:carboxymethylenebutenolidase